MADLVALRYSNPTDPDEPAPLPGVINPIPAEPVRHGDVIMVDAYLVGEDGDASWPWAGFELVEQP